MKSRHPHVSDRKWLLYLLIGSAIGGLIGGCSRSQSDKTPDGRTIIRLWQFWTEAKARAVIGKAAGDFETANPEYKVEITDLTWNDGHQKIVAAFAGGEAPDLLELGSDWIAEFADAQALMDLTSEYMQLRDTYAGWPASIYQDKCWALPWYLSTRVLYQNDELVSAIGDQPGHAPLTWDVLMGRAKKANQLQPKIFGYGVNAAEKHRLYKKFLPYLWSRGGSILTPDGSHCALNSPEGAAALQFVVDLSQYGLMEKQAQLDELFMENRLLYHISGDWLHERIKVSGSPVRYSAHLMPYPSVGEGGQISFAGGEYLTVPRRARQPLGAIKLARQLLNEKNIFNLCIATGCATPSHKTVAANPYFAEDSVRRVFVQQLEQSQAPPVHPRWVEIETELEWGVEQALYKKLTVSEALEQTCARIDKILAQPSKK